MSIVARNSPKCDLCAFDMWIENYTGVENPGPKIVEQELKKVNHLGSVKFFNGDSKLTIPKFKKDYPKWKIQVSLKKSLKHMVNFELKK